MGRAPTRSHKREEKGMEGHPSSWVGLGGTVMIGGVRLSLTTAGHSPAPRPQETLSDIQEDMPLGVHLPFVGYSYSCMALR